MSEEIENVEVDSIKWGENETRLGIDPDEISDLAASIGRIGLINPLTVKKIEDGFVIVAGHRRYQAALKCGMKTVPCRVICLEDAGVKEVVIAENLFRTDLSVVEEACMIHDVIESGTLDAAGVAGAMHRSGHWVQSRLDLLAWPDDVLAGLHDGKLSVAAGSNLALVTDDTYRNFLMRNAVEAGATARTTAAWLQAWRASAPAIEAVEAEPLAVGATAAPSAPQAPCIACGEIKRTDALATVLICPACVAMIRNAGAR